MMWTDLLAGQEQRQGLEDRLVETAGEGEGGMN